MPDTPFSMYLHDIDILLTGLSDQKRSELKRELQAHLEDAAEACDMSTNDITLQQDVIASLGSSLDLGEALYEAHCGRNLSKRIFDISFALLWLLALAPVFVMIAILIKLDSPGPVLYKDRRIGKNGRRFALYKFRTMTCWDDLCQPTSQNELRITRFGRFLRRRTLDELPQFFNVLRGEMSLVGPRPVRADDICMNDPAWRRVLLSPPGLTGPCLAVYGIGYRVIGADPRQQLEADLHYLEHASLPYDLCLIGRSLRMVVRHWKHKGRVGNRIV